MPIDLSGWKGLENLALGFVLALARIGSAFVFVSMPGLRSGSEVARVAIILGVTLALHAQWTVPVQTEVSIPMAVKWLVSECAFGICVGVAIALVLEIYQLASQMIGLQAGFSYASTIDPTNDTDSGVFPILVQLMSGLLFIGLGLDRQVIGAFGLSFQKIAPGGFVPQGVHVEELVRLGAIVFSTGLRVALPVIVLLLLLDIALALLSRIEQQVQITGVLFPVKNMAAFVLVAALLGALPGMFESTAEESLASLGKLMSR